MTPKENSLQMPGLPSRHQIGDEVMVNFGRAGSFFGEVEEITFTHGKVYYSIKIYPFTGEEANHHLSYIIKDVDSYFVKTPSEGITTTDLPSYTSDN